MLVFFIKRDQEGQTYFAVGIADRKRNDDSFCSKPFAVYSLLYPLGL